MSEGNKPENVGAVRGGDGATIERRWTAVVGKSGEPAREGAAVVNLVQSSRLQQVAGESNECSRERGLCFFLFIFFN